MYTHAHSQSYLKEMKKILVDIASNARKNDEFYEQAKEIFDLHLTNRNIDVIIP